MSTSPIESFLQVTQPSRQVAEANHSESLEAELFQQHLQRASSPSEPAEHKSAESLDETDDSSLNDLRT